MFAKLRRLIEPSGDDLDRTFQQLASLLRNSGKNVSVQFTILGGNQPRRWSMVLSGDQSQVVSQSASKSPNLEIITRDAAWWEIAYGKLSPIEAFRQGRLRVLGDAQLGSDLLRIASDGNGAAAICGE